MATDTHVMGLFQEEGKAVKAVEALKEKAWFIKRVHSPIPSHRLSEALQVKKSPVGWYTLTGGIIGFFTGFILAIYTAERWDLIVSGKPIWALIPFVIVGFEFTILFSIFGNLIGFLHQSKLPRQANLNEGYDPRCSGEHFGILVACEADRRQEVESFFTENGGEVRVFE